MTNLQVLHYIRAQGTQDLPTRVYTKKFHLIRAKDESQVTSVF